ncbi:hypothetical protein LTR64_001694 [Lithohypha guttulata]|uniref:uncharacterized protein n=1 Tax=Lithohypha guttulata TaxID=1690604 RepID=UPI002DDF9218|nr:hypothetical protein LTR51_003888 [Lithohypha guttulata]
MSDTEDNQPEQVPFQDQLLFGKHDLGMAAHWALALSPSTKQLLTPDCATKVSITLNAIVPTLDIVFNKHEIIDGVKQNIVSRLHIDSGACKLLDFKKIALPAFKDKKTDFTWPRGAVGISIEVTFDANCVADSRFFMGGQSWINSVRETVISEQKLLLWLAGGDSTMDNISKLQQQFHQDSTQVNLNEMFPAGQGRIVIQEGQFSPKDELDEIAKNAKDYRYRVPTNFHSKEHMAVEMCMAGLFARNEAEGKRSVYVETPKDMKIISLLSAFEESYLAFLPAPADDQTRLVPGDKLMIWFDFDFEDPDPSNDDAWSARVAEHIPDAPAILVPIHMNRPCDAKSGDSGAWKDDRELTTIDLRSLPADQPYAPVITVPGLMDSIKKDRNWLHKALLKVQANRPEDSYDVAPLGEDLKHAELVLKEAPKLRVGLAVTGDVVVRKRTKLIIWVALPGEEALVEKIWRAFHFDARMISADMSQEARRDVIEAFNTRDDACQILILTHAIGSSGLNLQYKCYTSIHLAVPLSRAQRDQADHRIRRWGQEKDRWNEPYDCTSWATQVKDTFNDRQWLNNLRKAYPSVLTELNKYIFNYQLRENAIGQVELEIPNWVKFRGRFLRDNHPQLEEPDVTPDDIEIANPEELMDWIADLERGKEIPFGE